MKGTKKITGGIGKVVLALLGAVFMPILIWVALGAAIKEVTQRKPTHTTRKILVTA